MTLTTAVSFAAGALPMNAPLDAFFGWVVCSSAQASVLVCLVLLAQWVLRERLTPRWRHALWLLVVVRLALPWTPQSSMSVFNLFAPRSEETRPSFLAAQTAQTGQPAPPSRTDPPASRPSDWTDRSDPSHPLLGSVLRAAWAVGAAALTAFVLAQALGLGAAVGRRRFLTDQRTLELLEDCKEEMGIRAYLAVVETDRVRSPALFGFVRPKLLLPSGTLDELGAERLRHVFLHELAHLKRRDVAVNWLMAALQVLHWFNPLVWYAFARMRAERELACDALALSRSRTSEPAEYGRTIVHLLERFSHSRALPGLAGVLEEKNQMKRRIAMIARFDASRRGWPLAAAALVVLLAATALTNAQQQAATGSGKEEIVRSACEFLALLVNEDYAGAVQRFDPTMKNALPEVKLKETWKGLLEQAGPFGQAEGFRLEEFLSFNVARIRCRFERGPLDAKVVFDADMRVSGLWFVPTSSGDYMPFDSAVRQGLSQAALKTLGAQTARPAADVRIEDFQIQPYPEGGLYTLDVALRNQSHTPSPKFKVVFHRLDSSRRNDPDRGLEPIREGYVYNEAGPIAPGEVWHEGSPPFSLREGVNELVVLIDPERVALGPGEEGKRADLKVTVKDGKIVETRADGQTSNARQVPVPGPAATIAGLLGDPEGKFEVLKGQHQEIRTDPKGQMVKFTAAGGVIYCSRDLDLVCDSLVYSADKNSIAGRGSPCKIRWGDEHAQCGSFDYDTLKRQFALSGNPRIDRPGGESATGERIAWSRKEGDAKTASGE